jgi:hypothetical protein
MEAPQQVYVIGQKGTILSGEYPGWIVEVVDDTEETGGYYVLIHDPNPKPGDWSGYDWWFEDTGWIPNLFRDMNWEIAWPIADVAGN